MHATVVVCSSMNVIRAYYICHVVIFMWPTRVSCITSLLFTTPPLWPHGIVNCPLDAYFRISVEVVGHPGTLCLWNWTYYCFHILFSTNYIAEKYVASHLFCSGPEWISVLEWFGWVNDSLAHSKTLAATYLHKYCNEINLKSKLRFLLKCPASQICSEHSHTSSI